MTSIFLGSGDDTYTALAAGDQVNGEDGNDALTAHAGGASLFGGNGTDTLNGGSGNDLLQGDNDNNLDAHNVVYGGGGDDVIFVNSGGEEVFGGSGNDHVRMGNAGRDQIVDGGADTDVLDLTAYRTVGLVDIALAPSFNAFVGNVAHAEFRGFEALNYVGGTGISRITGGDLGDAFLINSFIAPTFSAGILDGMGGDDVFAVYGITAARNERILGGSGTDKLTWVVVDELADASVQAGSGVITANGRRVITCSSIEKFDIRLSQVLGSFQFQGVAEDDLVNCIAATAIVKTGAGNDSISVKAGLANVQAGIGNDSIDINSTGSTASQGSGGDGNDILTLGGLGTILGEAGDDSLRTFDNRATLLGGSGNDLIKRQISTLDLASTSARLDGGNGIDTLDLNLNISQARQEIDFTQATTTLADGTTIAGFEIVRYRGGFVVDVVTASNGAGGAAVNTVDGGAGNDILRASGRGAALQGGVGDDLVLGAAGDDSLLGLFGLDTLRGGGGNDTINGEQGMDLMAGGGGMDTFLFRSWEFGIAVKIHDRIADFSQAEHDVIDISALDAKSSTLGVDDAFRFVGRDGLTGAEGELSYHLINRPGTARDQTEVRFAIAAGVDNLIVTLNGLIHLHEADFQL